MKNLKILGTLVAGLGTCGAILVLFRKEIFNLNKQEAEAKKGFIDAGLSETITDQLTQEPQTSQDECITKAMFALAKTSTNPKYSLSADQLDPEAFSDGYEDVIHVKETEFRGRKYLDFIVRVPDYTDESYTQPRIADYFRSGRKAADWMWENIVKFSEKPHCKMAGYATIEYLNPNYDRQDPTSLEKLIEFVELDPSIYAPYADEDREDKRGHDGLTKFYEIIQKEKNSLLSEVIEKFQEFLNNWIETVGSKSGSLVEVFLGYKISFRTVDKMRGNGTGIDCSRAQQCVKYLLKDFEVICGRNATPDNNVQYRSVLYCTTDPYGHESLAWHYNLNSGKIVPEGLQLSDKWD